MKFIIILSVLLLSCSQKINAQPIVKVWANEDSTAVVNMVLKYLDHLDVHEHIYIHISFSKLMPKKLEGFTIKQTALLSFQGDKKGKVFRVKIDAQLNPLRQKYVLAHEMIHIKQYVKGELQLLSAKKVLWKRKLYRQSDFNRRNNPWEQEAYRLDRTVVEILKGQPEVVPLTALQDFQ
ncbi:hypothetical protein OKW21_002337 [Catalinimonas alkaloidigena]|uniref:hypothetical protein n=1 Tax=Catalinimonas alkaloidigena TaxID=1075417 RepID=UPI0024052812|nr:hypothetical protein [Catalinimonas alkaloidigena]MDF9797074.1 hypothetical protein [Catalinimonas alkaloidigena]